MGQTPITLPVPLQIICQPAELIPEIDKLIRAEVAKLDRYYARIMSCRVKVEQDAGRHSGNRWTVRLDIVVSGGEIVVQKEPSVSGTARQTKQAAIRKDIEAKKDWRILRRVVRDAFASARRQLQDLTRKQRGDTKRTEPLQTAKITQVFSDKGYGFLITPEGKEVYFHKESVMNYSFEHLKPGTTVIYTEKRGEKGPQASSVKVMHKEGPHGTMHRHAA